MFHIIEDGVAVIRKKGIYKQTKVYQHKGQIYINYAGGFIYLLRKGTSVPDVSVDEIVLPFEPTYDGLGRMIVPADQAKKEKSRGKR